MIPIYDEHSHCDEDREKDYQATPFAPNSGHNAGSQPLAFCMAASCSGVASV
jgi:hypothetical protein